MAVRVLWAKCFQRLDKIEANYRFNFIIGFHAPNTFAPTFPWNIFLDIPPNIRYWFLYKMLRYTQHSNETRPFFLLIEHPDIKRH